MINPLAAPFPFDKVPAKGREMDSTDSAKPDSPVITDRVLVERSQAGDPTAFR